jgi:hypothetical protein
MTRPDFMKEKIVRNVISFSFGKISGIGKLIQSAS